MNCSHALNLISDYVDGALSPSTSDLLFEHIRQCRPCEMEFRAYECLHKLTSGLPPVEPPKTSIDIIRESAGRGRAPRKISCRRVRRLISIQLDVPLIDEEEAQLLAHIAVCTNCRRELSEIEHVVTAFRSLPDPVPPTDLKYRILNALATMQVRSQRSLWQRLAVPRARVTIAIASIMLFVSWGGSTVLRFAGEAARERTTDSSKQILMAERETQPRTLVKTSTPKDDEQEVSSESPTELIQGNVPEIESETDQRREPIVTVTSDAALSPRLIVVRHAGKKGSTLHEVVPVSNQEKQVVIMQPMLTDSPMPMVVKPASMDEADPPTIPETIIDMGPPLASDDIDTSVLTTQSPSDIETTAEKPAHKPSMKLGGVRSPLGTGYRAPRQRDGLGFEIALTKS